MLRVIALATFVLSSIWASADATPVVVNCDAGQSLNRALAKLDKLTPATVKFQGTCTEFVVVDGFNGLTLRGINGASIQQPATNSPASPFYVLSVKDSRGVTLLGFSVQSLPSAFSAIGVGKGSTDVLLENVQTNGAWGIVIYEASQVWLVNVNVNVTAGFAAVSAFDKSDVHIVGGMLHRAADSAYRAGLLVGSGHVTVQGMTIRDMQVGIDIGTSGSVDLVNFQPTTASPDVTIENPAGTNTYGVLVSDSSSLNLGSARLFISNAGQPYGFNSGAVFVTNGSTLNAGASLIVTSSRGQGVMVSNSSHAEMAGSSITGGGHGGLVVVNQSTAGATLTSPLTTISGNGTDLFCDSKSQITGSLYIANATVVQCNNLLPDLYESLP
jgi:hypothetical protein